MANFGRGKILDIDTGHSIIALRNAGSSEQTIGDDQVDMINLAGSNSSIAGGNGPGGDEAQQDQIDDLNNRLDGVEEKIQEQEDYQNGVKFIHGMNHTGDAVTGVGTSAFEWVFYTSLNLHAEYENNNFFNVYSTTNYANFAYGEIGDDATPYAPANVQGAVAQLQAVGPDATLIGSGSGSWSIVALGITNVGDRATIQARFLNNPSNVSGIVTTTGWATVGELVNTGGGTWLFTGSGGATTVDDTDGA